MINWVKKELKVRGWSQRELAKRSGVSHTLVSDALRGDRPITFDFCKAVAKGFNEPIWNVFRLAGVAENVPPEILQDEQIKVLVDKYKSLSPIGKAEFLKYLDFMILKENS